MKRRGNAVLIKVNQIGTLTEAIAAVRMAQKGRVECRDLPPFGRE